jgi:hypothetical protein
MITSAKAAPLSAGSALVGPAPASPIAGAVLLNLRLCASLDSASSEKGRATTIT